MKLKFTKLTEKKVFDLGYYRNKPENDTYVINTPNNMYYYNKISGNKIVPWKTLDDCIDALLELNEINMLEDIIKKGITISRVTADNYVVEEYSPEEVYDLANKFVSNMRDLMIADYFDESIELLDEEDTEIEVKNPGILEVPEGKKVNELPQSHFEKLAKKKGLGKITKALNNLQVWNKNDDPELSKWAGNMIDKLNNKLKKDEAVSKRDRKRSTGKSNSVASFIDRQIESGKIDEKQVTVVYDKNNNIMWLGKAGLYPLLMSNVEYRSSGYDKDHPHEFWINARSYTEPFGESYKKRLTIKESPMDYLDTNERAIVDKLEQLGYRGSKPIKFDGKLMGYWDKVYYTDKKSSSGVQIYIDPFDGSVEVQEFVNDIDTEDLTYLCPVKYVTSANDVLKIDRWAKTAKKHSYSLNYESVGYDRYDPNVEARFMNHGDEYSDMPDLYDLYAANKGLPVSEFIKDARDGGFSRTEIDAFLKDNNITGKMCEDCGTKKKKGSRKLKEGSNFDNVTDAIDYYYGKWLYDDISYNGIADELAGLGHSERFIDAVLDGITQLYDDQERYDYEHDYYDE